MWPRKDQNRCAKPSNHFHPSSELLFSSLTWMASASYLSVDVIPLLGKGSFISFTNDELVVPMS